MVGCSSLLFFPLVSTSDLYSYIWLPLIFISQSIIPITHSRHLISYLGSHFHFDLYHEHAQSAFRFYIFPDVLALLWKNCYLARLDNRRWTSTFCNIPRPVCNCRWGLCSPHPIAKLDREKKGKPKEKNEKKEDDLSHGTNSTTKEADLSDLNLPYRCQVVVSPIFNNLRDTSSSLPKDTRSPTQARVIRPLLRSAGKCCFRV